MLPQACRAVLSILHRTRTGHTAAAAPEQPIRNAPGPKAQPACTVRPGTSRHTI